MRGARRDSESGQTLVVFAVFLVVLLMFMGVVIDGGMYFVQKRDMQGVADAAAMAAVRELPGDPGDANILATQYVAHNDEVDGTLADFDLANANTEVSVEVATSGDTSFGSLLGINAPPIAARATAEVTAVSSMPGMLPLGVLEDQFAVTNPPTRLLIGDGGNNKNGILWPKGKQNCTQLHGSDVRDAISGKIRTCAAEPGEEVDAQTGWAAGNIKNGFDDLIGSNRQSFDDVFKWDSDLQRYIVLDPDSPRIGVLPIVKDPKGSSNWVKGDMEVVGYTLCYLGDSTKSPSYPVDVGGKSIVVYPVEAVIPSDWEFNTSGSGDFDTAPLTFRLTE